MYAYQLKTNYHLLQFTNLQCDKATPLWLFEHMKQERVRYWNLKHTRCLHVFSSNNLNYTIYCSLVSFQKHLASNETTGLKLTHKNTRLYWHVNSATLPPSCTIHWQSLRCTIHDMHLPPNTGHFFVKIFIHISSSDAWILTYGEWYYNSMQKMCKF